MQHVTNFLLRHYRYLTFFLFILITALSLFPLPRLPEVPGQDKTMHTMAYAALAFPVSFARPKAYVWILLGFLAWGGVIEFIQPYVNRYMELADFLANGIGLVLGFLAGRLAALLSRKHM